MYTQCNILHHRPTKDTSPMGPCARMDPSSDGRVEWPKMAINDRCVHVLGKHCTPFPFPC
jgi:hypothetical protein